MKRLVLRLLPLVDLVLLPVTMPGAFFLKLIRRYRLDRFPLHRRALLRLGVLPITDHYYDPFPEKARGERTWNPRPLPGIDFRLEQQLKRLKGLTFAEEILEWPLQSDSQGQYFLENPYYTAGDAEMWYQLVRSLKPRRIYEIGGGYSTVIARQAIQANAEDNSDYDCDHVCIEPYEMPWLEASGAQVVRSRVQDVSLELFSELGEGDVLFIDSSHVIRADGDVLFEYLQILPTLRPGVIVHVHDIFSPRDYRPQWVHDRVRIWTEQYLLESILSTGNVWEILISNNHLKNSEFKAMSAVCPHLKMSHEPGSIYIRKTGP